LPKLENFLTNFKINGIPYAKNTVNYQVDSDNVVSLYYLQQIHARIIEDNKVFGTFDEWTDLNNDAYPSLAKLTEDLDKFLFSIATSPQQSFTLGSLIIAFEDIGNVKRLFCGLDGTANGAFTPFLLGNGSTYSVPVDTVLIVAVLSWATNARFSLSLGYADDATGTNYVEVLDESIMSPENNYSHDSETIFIIPTGKFPIANNTAAITTGFVIMQGLQSATSGELQQIASLNQVKVIDNLQATNSLLDSDYFLRVARGLVVGSATEQLLSIDNDIDTGEKTLGIPSGRYIFQDTAVTLEVLSDNAEDNPAGIGAGTVEIIGYDIDSLLISEIKNMDGTTPVTTDNQYFRIKLLRVDTFGSSENNEGLITLRVQGDGDYQSSIDPDSGISTIGTFHVPANTDAYLWQTTAATSKGKDVDIVAYVGGQGITTLRTFKFNLYQNIVSNILKIPVKFPEKTDFEVTGSSSNPNASITVTIIAEIVDR